MRDEVDFGLQQRFDMCGARPPDLLFQPACQCRRSVGSSKNVGSKHDAPAAQEEVGGEVAVFVDNHALPHQLLEIPGDQDCGHRGETEYSARTALAVARGSESRH